MSHRRPILAVIGGADADADALALAEAVGAAVARAEAGLLCGGRGGVMEAAARGAAAGGGLTVGILPGASCADANPHVAVAIATGIGDARNAVIARSADALIAVGGRYGTLSEIAFGLAFGKRVVSLESWVLEDRGGDLHYADDAAQAVRVALEAPACLR